MEDVQALDFAPAHDIYVVKLNSSKEEYVLDLCSAQFGHHTTITPVDEYDNTRVDSAPADWNGLYPLGTFRNDIIGRLNEAPETIPYEKISKVLEGQIHDWSWKNGCRFRDVLDLDEESYRAKVMDMLTCLAAPLMSVMREAEERSIKNIELKGSDASPIRYMEQKYGEVFMREHLRQLYENNMPVGAGRSVDTKKEETW
jgi:hypothetical protein